MMKAKNWQLSLPVFFLSWIINGGIVLLDEHEWKYVLQAASDGTFSGAARHLFVSQPSLSQCIKKIEGELGTPLFDRRQTPLTLTAAGKIYVRKAKEIQRIAQELVQETADLTELRSGSLCIGSSRTRSSCYLLDPLIRFHRLYPGINLSVREHGVNELRDDIAGGKVDFALLYEPLADDGLQSTPLLRERVLLAVPWEHKLTAEFKGKQPWPLPRLSFAKMDKLPFIKLQAARRMSTVYTDLCAKLAIAPQVVFEADSIIDAAELSAKGMGATLVTDMLAANDRWQQQLCFFELAEPVADRILVAAYNQNLSQAAKRFIEMLKI